MIYAMTADNGRFVKFGFTAGDSLEKRAAQLQTGNPYIIRPLFGVDGTLLQEKALHAAVGMMIYRIRLNTPGNEWYPAKHPVMKKLTDVLRQDGVNQAIAYCDTYNPSVKRWGTSERFKNKNRRRELSLD